MTNLYQDWLDAKKAEKEATEKRRMIEMQLVAQFEVPEIFEGTKTIEDQGFKIKITGRMARKINSDLLQEIANENGLAPYLSTLFRWKPEIDAKAYQNADSSITDILSQAITTTPSKPTFTITKE